MNMAEQQIETRSLYIQRIFNTHCNDMFKAWTDPDILEQWFAPEGVITEAAEVDLRVGGDYKITLKLPDGERVQHYGTYREITPPEKLVFTWILDGEGCEGHKAEKSETLVTVEFNALGNQTEVCLTHELFMTEKAKEMHSFGWNGCLDGLDRMLK